jgi:predicted nucleic acid-binding protein
MGADAYADSSFLVSLHRADSFHQAANAFLGKAAFTLAFTPLHRIEVRNALRNATAAGDMTKADCATAFRQIDEDLRDGLLVHEQVHWTEAFRRADQLSETHAGTEGQRTIDLLHVALALECGARTFLSFDKRQRKLAKSTGLAVKP